jgi:hypothetical protein
LNALQKTFFWPLFRVCLAFFALKNQFVLSLFFDSFVDSKELIEFVPSILTSFSHFPDFFPFCWPRPSLLPAMKTTPRLGRGAGRGVVGASASLQINQP